MWKFAENNNTDAANLIASYLSCTYVSQFGANTGETGANLSSVPIRHEPSQLLFYGFSAIIAVTSESRTLCTLQFNLG